MASSPGFQSGNAGFESRWDHCGYRTKVSTSDCESDDMGSTPIGHTCIINAVCPGSEEAVLKTVGPKGWQGPSGTCYATNRPSRQARLAGSNPVCGA